MLKKKKKFLPVPRTIAILFKLCNLYSFNFTITSLTKCYLILSNLEANSTQPGTYSCPSRTVTKHASKHPSTVTIIHLAFTPASTHLTFNFKYLYHVTKLTNIFHSWCTNIYITIHS